MGGHGKSGILVGDGVGRIVPVLDGWCVLVFTFEAVPPHDASEIMTVTRNIGTKSLCMAKVGRLLFLSINAPNMHGPVSFRFEI